MWQSLLAQGMSSGAGGGGGGSTTSSGGGDYQGFNSSPFKVVNGFELSTENIAVIGALVLGVIFLVRGGK